MRTGERRSAGALEALRAALADEGVGATAEPAAEPLGALVAAGPRAAGDPATYRFVVEAVLEGYLLHYGRPRLGGIDDPDLRLLAGDLAYASGLARLAETGDGEAVSELGDLISLCAQLHAGAPAPAPELVAALWALAAIAVGAGGWAGYEEVKRALRTAAADATARALGEARHRACDVGIEPELDSALIAFPEMASPASGVRDRGHLDG